MEGVAKGEDAAPIEIIDAEIGEFMEFDIGEAIICTLHREKSTVN